MHVTVACHYPGTDLPSDRLTHDVGEELGSTSLEVHQELARRMRSGWWELPVAGGMPVQIWSETVREIVVR